MNIWQNGIQKRIDNTTGSITLSGNGNRLLVVSSAIQLTINGNSNEIECMRSRINVTVNGNNNDIVSQWTEVRIGFNGNHNSLRSDPTCRTQILFTNGNNNTHYHPNQPQSHRQHPNQPPSQRQHQNSNQRQLSQRQSSRNRRENREEEPNQRPQWLRDQQAYQQQQLYEQQQRQRNLQQQQDQRRRQRRGQLQQQQIAQQQEFQQHQQMQQMMQQTQQMINQIHRQVGGFMGGLSRPRRVYFFHNEREDSDSYGEEEEEGVQRGLTREEISLLPRSRHSGAEGKCTICLSEVGEGEQQTFLACFHSFHWQCIRDWLVKSSKCPMCQYDLKQYLQPTMI